MIAQIKQYLKTLIQTEVGLDNVLTEQEQQRTFKKYPAALIGFADEPIELSRSLVARKEETGKVTQTKRRAKRRPEVLVIFVSESADGHEEVDGYLESFLRVVDGFTDVTANEHYTLAEIASAEFDIPASPLQKKAKASVILIFEKEVYVTEEIDAVGEVVFDPIEIE